MALRRGPRIEDAVIGSFVLLALLYPILVTLLIHLQERRDHGEDTDLLRVTYLFVTGLEDCSPETASRIAHHMERDLLRRLGGIAGLVEMCRRGKELTAGGVSIDEEVRREGSRITLYVSIGVREKGVVRRRLSLRLTGVREGGEFRITEVTYAEGR